MTHYTTYKGKSNHNAPIEESPSQLTNNLQIAADFPSIPLTTLVLGNKQSSYFGQNITHALLNLR